MSVLIVTYNHSKFITEAIESILHQTYKNIEIIIADDCSSDGATKIIKKYVEKYPDLKAVFSKKNTGMQYNFNRGLKLVKGEYFVHIDGDDTMFPDKIRKQVEYLNINKDVSICAHDMEVYDVSKNKTIGLFSEVVSGKKIRGKVGVEFLFDPLVYLSPSSMMYRRGCMPYEGFEEDLKYANDLLFHMKILVNDKLGYIDEVLGMYRKHGGNISSDSNAKNEWPGEILKVLSMAETKWPHLRQMIKKRRNVIYLSEAVRFLKSGEKTKAREFSKKLISDGSVFKGMLAYFISFIASKNLVNFFFNKSYSKRLWGRMLGH